MNFIPIPFSLSTRNPNSSEVHAAHVWSNFGISYFTIRTGRVRLGIAKDTALGMKSLYAHGMQHRHLSSKSILLTSDFRAKVRRVMEAVRLLCSDRWRLTVAVYTFVEASVVDTVGFLHPLATFQHKSSTRSEPERGVNLFCSS